MLKGNLRRDVNGVEVRGYQHQRMVHRNWWEARINI